jgi:subtilisin family serine protease
VVYVVDTGLNTGTTIRNLQHLELKDRIAPGYSWIQDGNGTDDCNGHGTHVAGTIAGTLHGVAKLATVVPVRVLDCGGFGNTSDVIAALDWIAASRDRSKPAVVNVSLSGPASPILDTVAARLSDSGVTVVVAAGNDDADACNYSPARADSVLAVAASNTSDYRAAFSNYGPCVDLFAPGMYIESASIATISSISSSGGTSSSAALVAGAAALILGENPGLTSAQVRDRLVSSSTPGAISNPGPGTNAGLLYLPYGNS